MIVKDFYSINPQFGNIATLYSREKEELTKKTFQELIQENKKNYFLALIHDSHGKNTACDARALIKRLFDQNKRRLPNGGKIKQCKIYRLDSEGFKKFFNLRKLKKNHSFYMKYFTASDPSLSPKDQAEDAVSLGANLERRGDFGAALEWYRYAAELGSFKACFLIVSSQLNHNNRQLDREGVRYLVLADKLCPPNSEYRDYINSIKQTVDKDIFNSESDSLP